MKYLKLLSICLLASFAMGVSAAVTAQATITVMGDLSQEGPADLSLVEDVDATINDNGPYNPSGNVFIPEFYALNGTSKISAVAIPSLEGLQIKFIANAYETAYTMSFSNVSGTEYFLQKGDDAQNLIPMTEDYAITCAVSEVITFTVVKEAPVPPVYADYSRQNLTIDHWYTICLPEASVSFSGMDLYKVAGYSAQCGLGVDPVEGQMEAGMPYIFQATATEISVFYVEDGEVKEEPVAGANYLTGTFEEMTTSTVAYVVANNKLNWAAAGTAVPAYRAYLNYPDITDGNFPVVNPIYPAPGRKFLPAPKGVVTNLEGATVNGLQNGTYMVNGQIMIVKDGKTFNVLGL